MTETGDLRVAVNTGNRAKKALLVSMVVGSCLLCLVVFLIAISKREVPYEIESTPIASFLLKDERGRYWTNKDLQGALTVLWVVPKTCQEFCGQDMVEKVQSLVGETLRTQSSGGEKNPVNLIVIEEVERGLSYPSQWAKVKLSVADEPFLKAFSGGINRAFLVLVDDKVQAKAVVELSPEADEKAVATLLAKHTTHQFLNNYLSRRTFMGPKRNQTSVN